MEVALLTATGSLNVSLDNERPIFIFIIGLLTPVVCGVFLICREGWIVPKEQPA